MLASRSRGEFSVPNELDYVRVEQIWDDLETQLNTHGAWLKTELERLERLKRIAQGQSLDSF